jgi:Myb-like DNA-binding domain
MAGSEHDLATLMVEVDVPLEDMPDSCEDAAEASPQQSSSGAPARLPLDAVDKASSALVTTPMAAQASSVPPHAAPSSTGAARGTAPHAPLKSQLSGPSVPGAHPPHPGVPLPTKSKKKKSAAGAALGLGKDAVDKGENVGRWTAEEHRLFLQGLEQHGKGWKKIASLIKTRSVVQIRYDIHHMTTIVVHACRVTHCSPIVAKDTCSKVLSKAREGEAKRGRRGCDHGRAGWYLFRGVTINHSGRPHKQATATHNGHKAESHTIDRRLRDTTGEEDGRTARGGWLLRHYAPTSGGRTDPCTLHHAYSARFFFRQREQ